jgi:hypothetical protein
MPPELVQPSEPFTTSPVPPDLLAWAKQTLDVVEFTEEMRQTEATGCSLQSFLSELRDRATHGR